MNIGLWRKVKTKYSSESGVSILFALMFLLIASMVAVTILAASTTTAKRIHDDKVRTQDYLALRSAAEYFSEQLANTTITLEYTGSAEEISPGGIEYTSYGNPPYSFNRIKETLGPLSGSYFQGVYEACRTSPSGSADGSFSIELAGGSVSIPKTDVEFTMTQYPGDTTHDKAYISGQFSVAGSTKDVQKIYFFAAVQLADPEYVRTYDTLDESDFSPEGYRTGTAYYDKVLRWPTVQYDSTPITPEL